MSALFKVPCILLVSLAFHNAFTSPNAPDPEERAPVNTLGERFVKLGMSMIRVRKAILWGLGVMEIIAILANTLPVMGAVPQPASNLVKMLGQVDDLYLTPSSAAGMLLIVSGSLIRWQCYRTMKHLFTFEISIRKDHRLVTTGPYGVVRHPSYMGTLAVHIGMYCWFGSRGSWLRESGLLDTVGGRVSAILFATSMTGVLVGLLRRVPVEDAMLKRTFGKQWDVWARRVPYALVPGLY
ncbi:hypothetical protein D9615_007182 [Tricholomella constricta]|uniref:Protein-S-isoprenylcysteine O-methyltransferase n=1 Tax=Tricholomella constricta TaxID=117010 RepID=A0A8H5H8J7_9AGAR|nr:hypothetical protein D9615_007182 [Tricholomella constricta]